MKAAARKLQSAEKVEQTVGGGRPWGGAVESVDCGGCSASSERRTVGLLNIEALGPQFYGRNTW
jgi:hypothetical protein